MVSCDTPKMLASSPTLTEPAARRRCTISLCRRTASGRTMGVHGKLQIRHLTEASPQKQARHTHIPTDFALFRHDETDLSAKRLAARQATGRNRAPPAAGPARRLRIVLSRSTPPRYG